MREIGTGSPYGTGKTYINVGGSNPYQISTALTTFVTIVSLVLPANHIYYGQHYRITVAGDATNPSDGAPAAFQVAARIGATPTTLVALSMLPPVSTAQTKVWRAQFDIWPQVITSTGRIFCDGILVDQVASRTNYSPAQGQLSLTPIDLTVNQTLQVAFLSGKSGVGWGIAAYGADIEKVKT
jgi:hypothetical protein